ncbi:amidophosphoribosyltransferase [Tichowtungia aerotolerans]|uniref:Amidophosphoribosyltransferase n=1 Tax=Tichowtungia aerotolerans TaxID=2697043 RepID=A0A6P1MCQ1_9BACT|nr:amidophosphoribosyltransferase [Tichowtungia aerotolerans]QHI69376.1 amidophosphoribosyltransferase [Tichowtungia aerotolerans]
MGGFFGAVLNRDCVSDVFYGTDYHSHLGTQRGGIATLSDDGSFTHFIHDIRNAQFRSKFDSDFDKMNGKMAIGVISDYEDQPLIINSRHGRYAIATVGAVQNAAELEEEACAAGVHFSEMSGNEVNPTELIAHLINQGSDFADGLAGAQEAIEGSASILLLTKDGIYAARDRLGRTPVIVGKGEDGYAVTLETCALPNLQYSVERELGPGEIVRITAECVERLKCPGDCMKFCTFMWVYYGYPASSYEGHNAEDVRNECGRKLAQADDVTADCTCGIPDSGTAHALGYAQESGLPYRRSFVKYTPTWPRSFMPQNQTERNRVAKMKLIPVREFIEGKRLLFCEDSIVRGTQLQDTIDRLYTEYGAEEIHMRAACPPLVFGCKYLNFSRSRSIDALATRIAIKELEGEYKHLDEYADATSEKYEAMVEKIRERLNLTSLKFQTLDDLVDAIGLPKEKLCTYCWDGQE